MVTCEGVILMLLILSYHNDQGEAAKGPDVKSPTRWHWQACCCSCLPLQTDAGEEPYGTVTPVACKCPAPTNAPCCHAESLNVKTGAIAVMGKLMATHLCLCCTLR